VCDSPTGPCEITYTTNTSPRVQYQVLFLGTSRYVSRNPSQYHKGIWRATPHVLDQFRSSLCQSHYRDRRFPQKVRRLTGRSPLPGRSLLPSRPPLPGRSLLLSRSSLPGGGRSRTSRIFYFCIDFLRPNMVSRWRTLDFLFRKLSI
jgi:hypothetical protein